MTDGREHGKFASRVKRALDATKERAKKFSDEADWVVGRRPARVLGVVLLFAVVGALLLVLLDWYVAPTKPSDKKDLVLALAQILAGTALLAGLYFTWRTLQVNREGQITDRFTRAIDQLGKTDDKGNKLLDIRLGGIYALERIDKESPERAYHSTVMEVLTAYVRENAPWSSKCSESKRAEQGAELAQGGPSTDIQAILEVIKRREEDRVPCKHRIQSLDLRRTNLRGANLSGAHLEGAHLQAALLEGANLRTALLEGANLSGAYLKGANLIFTHLEGAVLGADISEISLKGAELRGADLEKADLSGAYLKKANLYRVHLEGAVLEGTHLEGVNLVGAYLKGAKLSGAHLKGAELRAAHLEGADLSFAHLEGAALNAARLKGANLTGAELEKADLSGAYLKEARYLTLEQIEWAIGTDNTELPEYLVDQRPPSWSKIVGEQRKILQERLERESKDE